MIAKVGDCFILSFHSNCSHAFGFGLMDAGKMVERAENWRKVPQQKKCSIEYDGGKNMSKVERFGE